MRKSWPPAMGSRVSPATAENVVKPAQKPGNKKWRKFSFPLRSMKTTIMVAMATPMRLAIKVAFRLSPTEIVSQYRTGEPATPPSETKKSDFRAVELSL